MVDENKFKQAVDLINASKSVLITAHTRPDGDACGSVRALCDSIKSLGKEAHPIFLSPMAAWYEFLFDSKVPILGNDITTEELNAKPYSDCDLVLIVDTNSYVQLPQFDQWLKRSEKKVLVIDHHITGDNLGDIELIDTSAAAAGEIVCDLMKYAGWKLTEEIAEAIFVAIATDSGWFKFANADARIFRNAADLIEAGANPAKIYQQLFQSYSPERMKLMIVMLKSLELHFENRLAMQVIMRKDFDETGATGKDTENLINECNRIGSVDMAALFVELADGGYRCSLRSKGKVDVRKIAQKYGGGGHTMASGVNLPGPLEKAKQIILDEAKLQLKS
ncbi:MAG: bifunctional oligoribonuclease/PAP phosphatase NrnA [Planctomycetes bacterium]|nr:bifunctional oligoribonuclease/PAP phosphatase NrnA [Planctomycetota bacterium]